MFDYIMLIVLILVISYIIDTLMHNRRSRSKQKVEPIKVQNDNYRELFLVEGQSASSQSTRIMGERDQI